MKGGKRSCRHRLASHAAVARQEDEQASDKRDTQLQQQEERAAGEERGTQWREEDGEARGGGGEASERGGKVRREGMR